jgi:proline racemase
MGRTPDSTTVIQCHIVVTDGNLDSFAALRRATRVFQVVDSHTAGTPTRVVTGGVGALPGRTMAERARRLASEDDQIRSLLMQEPHGHSAMSGAILQPPCRDDADWGVVFIEVSGYLPMCGHGTMGVATVLVELGLVAVREPETSIRLDVPAGVIEARVRVRAGRADSVTLRNVPAFHVGAGSAAGVDYELAFGGNFYAIAEAAQLGLAIEPANASALIEAGLELMAALPEPVHPEDPEIAGCRHVIWTGPPATGADGRAATTIHPGWLDRSPCGTGTSARMALLHARDELDLGASYVHESLLGTRFVGRLVEECEVGGRRAVVPEITGSAWITAAGRHLLESEDPFPLGFRVG